MVILVHTTMLLLVLLMPQLLSVTDAFLHNSNLNLNRRQAMATFKSNIIIATAHRMPSSFCLNSSRNRYNDNDNDNDNTAAPDAGKSKTAPNKTGVQPERRRREQRTTNITPRSSNSNNSSRSSSANAMTSLLVAAAFVTASLGPTMDVVANAAAAPVAADAANTPVLNLVSPGTLILEAPVLQKPQ